MNFNEESFWSEIEYICPSFKSPISRVLGPGVPGHRSKGPSYQGPWSQVLILGYALF